MLWRKREDNSSPQSRPVFIMIAPTATSIRLLQPNRSQYGLGEERGGAGDGKERLRGEGRKAEGMSGRENEKGMDEKGKGEEEMKKEGGED